MCPLKEVNLHKRDWKQKEESRPNQRTQMQVLNQTLIEMTISDPCIQSKAFQIVFLRYKPQAILNSQDPSRRDSNLVVNL